MRRAVLTTLALLTALSVGGGPGPAVAQETAPPAGAPALGVDGAALIGTPLGRALSGEELEATTERLASLMRCPVCQGLSIADSPTPLAQAMKGEVRQFLAAGYSPQQVLEYFERSYGEFIRLEPKAKGFNLLVWAAPLGGLLIGLWLVSRRLRSAGAATEAAVDEAELAAYRERVRRESAS